MGVVDNEVKAISKLVPIPLAGLHYQYIHGMTPIDIWNYDLSIENSPHVELLRLIQEHGLDWNKLKSTRYVAERRLRREKGNKKWTDEYIMGRLARRWEIYRSLKKIGYKPEKYKFKGGVETPVRILKEPLWTTRFGFKADWLSGPELFDGAGRCSAAYVLGWKEIPAIWVEDKNPGSNDKGGFEEKLLHVKDIWDFLGAKV